MHRIHPHFALHFILGLHVQGPLEAELDVLETYRNGRRLDLVYVSGQNPLSAKLLQLEEEHAQLSPGSRSQIRVQIFSDPLHAQI